MRKTIPFKSRGSAKWWLAILASLCSCATEQYLRWVSPNDLVCKRDEDCVIFQGDVLCSDQGDDQEPYAISRAAIGRRQRELESSGKECIILDRGFLCTNDPSEWKVVCSDHTCERRSALWFRDPKPHCRY
jgi:hypothetical protein